METTNIRTFLQGLVVVVGIYYLLQITLNSLVPRLCDHNYLCDPVTQKKALVVTYVLVCFVIGLIRSQKK